MFSTSRQIFRRRAHGRLLPSFQRIILALFTIGTGLAALAEAPPDLAAPALTEGSVSNQSSMSVISNRTGLALWFNGIDQLVRVDSGINLSNVSFSVEFWAKR